MGGDDSGVIGITSANSTWRCVTRSALRSVVDAVARGQALSVERRSTMQHAPVHLRWSTTSPISQGRGVAAASPTASVAHPRRANTRPQAASRRTCTSQERPRAGRDAEDALQRLGVGGKGARRRLEGDRLRPPTKEEPDRGLIEREHERRHDRRGSLWVGEREGAVRHAFGQDGGEHRCQAARGRGPHPLDQEGATARVIGRRPIRDRSRPALGVAWFVAELASRLIRSAGHAARLTQTSGGWLRGQRRRWRAGDSRRPP